MEFIFGLSKLNSSSISSGLGCVATIGAFDGLHLGHQRVLQSLRQKAIDLGLPTLVIVFEPQPSEYFAKDKAPARLMRLRDKYLGFADLGIDHMLCIKFDHALRSLSAESYVKKVLVDGIGVKHLVIGDDFRFGCDRAGDFAFLQDCGKRFGFEVSDTKTLAKNDDRISSTRIRKLLELGEFSNAESMLGKAYAIHGRVSYGLQNGRAIGFPTMNIDLGRHRSPLLGVYCVETVLNGNRYSGIANVGVRPTVGDKSKVKLEVHLFDFDQVVYGECVEVRFLRKVRDEKKFESFDFLKAQIAEDVKTAKTFFEHN